MKVAFIMELQNNNSFSRVQIPCQVWGRHFTKMAIRRVSQHSSCTTCGRRKMILKRLSGDSQGRALQMREYQAHLSRQYRDRCCYWANRSKSRTGMQPTGQSTITLICDGMDKSKYRYPRSLVCTTKEFSGMIRPSLDLTAIITHGHNVILACSEPYTKKDSAWTAELISHALTKVAETNDIRQAEIIIQCDNCGRENKNNTLCRLGGLLVGSGRVGRLELNFLESGHSHEDIDQYFSGLSNMLEREREIHTPHQFLQKLESFMAQPGHRQFEASRHVYKVDQVRNWRLFSISVCFSC